MHAHVPAFMCAYTHTHMHTHTHTHKRGSPLMYNLLLNYARVLCQTIQMKLIFQISELN